MNFGDPSGRIRMSCDDPDADSIYDGSCSPASDQWFDSCGGADLLYDPYNPNPNPACYAQVPAAGPQAGGGSSFAPTRATGYGSTRADLGKLSCYTMFGFASAAAAQGYLDGVKFDLVHNGNLQIDGNGNPLGTAAGGPAPAQTVGNTVQINIDYNWSDFSNTQAKNVVNGGTAPYDYLKFVNNSMNRNMTSDELASLIVLHELTHVTGMPRSLVETPEFYEKIAKNCF